MHINCDDVAYISALKTEAENRWRDGQEAIEDVSDLQTCLDMTKKKAREHGCRELAADEAERDGHYIQAFRDGLYDGVAFPRPSVLDEGSAKELKASNRKLNKRCAIIAARVEIRLAG